MVHSGNSPYPLGTHFLLQLGNRGDPVEGADRESRRPKKNSPPEVHSGSGTIITTIFQMRKLKPRDAQ